MFFGHFFTFPVQNSFSAAKSVSCVARGGVLSNFELDQVFSFEGTVATPPQPTQSPTRGPVAQEDFAMELLGADQATLNRALEAAGEAAYHWTISDDEIVWSSNASEILFCRADLISSGKRFAVFMDAENLTTRYDTVMRTQTTDQGKGVPFSIEYLFRCEGKDSDKSIWVEDQGRWHAGPDGRPAHVYGTVRPINDRHKRDQHLNFLGNCDPLTGMMNRGRLTEALGEAITVAGRERSNCAFAIAAVNNLSVVNEAYGFEVADEVIVALGRRLREVMRAGDGIARYSGGKFGIILNNCDEKELKIALERFLASVRDSVIETQHGPVWAMLSIGALCLPAQAHDANTATARAEEALNEARKLPSDGYVIFKPSEARTNERKLNARCATEIVKCLKSDLFKLAFQPIVSAKTGEVVLHEALLRMSDDQSNELIAAKHLMPMSERLGLIRLIDRSVTQMIVNTLHKYPEARLAMNVSATTATDPRWYNQILEIITANSSVADRLVVEITETVALNDVVATRQFVESLRTIGCSVAIDDFGAGYTSFKNLRDLQVDMLKLDGSFCSDLKNNPENEYIVRSLIDLSKKFNLKIVAEWIENEEDAELLRAWGVDYMQGHLLGEASIVPPWTKEVETTFSLEPEAGLFAPQFEQLIKPVLALETEVIEPQVTEPETIANEPEIIAAPETAVIAEPDYNEPIETHAELDFSGIDESISSLKQMLDSLHAETQDDEAERNAA